MGQNPTPIDLIDPDPIDSDFPPRSGAHLQCFAGDADDPADCAGQIIPITIHTLSPRRVTTGSTPDLRIGAIVRLSIPKLGWRHLEIRWIAGGKAGGNLLLPLLPYELRLALDQERIGREASPPPRRGRPTPRPISARTSAPRRTSASRPFPTAADVATVGQALTGAMARLFAGLSVARRPRPASA